MLKDVSKKGLKFVVIVLCFMYIASPIDFLPEALLGPFGLIDDLLVMVIMGLAVLTDMDWLKDVLKFAK